MGRKPKRGSKPSKAQFDLHVSGRGLAAGAIRDDEGRGRRLSRFPPRSSLMYDSAMHRSLGPRRFWLGPTYVVRITLCVGPAPKSDGPPVVALGRSGLGARAARSV